MVWQVLGTTESYDCWSATLHGLFWTDACSGLQCAPGLGLSVLT
jgi:hypothetical protein